MLQLIELNPRVLSLFLKKEKETLNKFLKVKTKINEQTYRILFV